jgi:hypothetical protein
MELWVSYNCGENYWLYNFRYSIIGHLLGYRIGCDGRPSSKSMLLCGIAPHRLARKFCTLAGSSAVHPAIHTSITSQRMPQTKVATQVWQDVFSEGVKK